MFTGKASGRRAQFKGNNIELIRGVVQLVRVVT